MAYNNSDSSARTIGGIVVGVLIVVLVMLGILVYQSFRIDVPQGHIAVLTKRTGLDLENNQIVAPDEKHKGLQLKILTESRSFRNPYHWDWNIYPMVDIPAGKMGVRVRLYGENLPYAHFLATKDTQKGIVKEVLKPGRYDINAMIKGQEAARPLKDYVEIIELYEPVNIPAGYRGVVTDLAGPMPDDPNTVLVEDGFRGVQKKTLDAGLYYLNPYRQRVNLVDCRSIRFNLGEGHDMGFPSKDGFWVSLDGIIEFRVRPEKASEIFVLYNEPSNDSGPEGTISEEIVKKIIMPNARSFCRLRGSNSTGREFIGGDTRTAFQKDFASAMQEACDGAGIEIVQALITKIKPPDAIASPVRDREIARQQLGQYKEQVLQQKAEADLAKEKALIKQRQEMVAADQKVTQEVTKAMQEQEVAVTKAEEKLAVAQRDLEASKDQAAAMLARKKAEAGIIDFENLAEAAGWKKAVEALSNDGEAYANYIMLQKLAPAYRQIMANSSDSPLMKIFENFGGKPSATKPENTTQK